MSEFDQRVLWNILGKAVTIAMIPWMVWVSITIVTVQRDVAVLASQTTGMPNEVRMLRDRIIRLELQIEGLRAEHERGQ